MMEVTHFAFFFSVVLLLLNSSLNVRCVDFICSIPFLSLLAANSHKNLAMDNGYVPIDDGVSVKKKSSTSSSVVSTDPIVPSEGERTKHTVFLDRNSFVREAPYTLDDALQKKDIVNKDRIVKFGDFIEDADLVSKLDAAVDRIDAEDIGTHPQETNSRTAHSYERHIAAASSFLSDLLRLDDSDPNDDAPNDGKVYHWWHQPSIDTEDFEFNNREESVVRQVLYAESRDNASSLRKEIVDGDDLSLNDIERVLLNAKIACDDCSRTVDTP